MLITFVVLHYESLKDTKDCVDSLIKYLDMEKVHIVLVDNGSRREKLYMLENYYNDPRIHFIYSEINLGFAKGNNLGFKYAKKELQSDVIILCNNDLIFRQDGFIANLRQELEVEKFDIAGPTIISLVDGKNQNPVPFLYPSINIVKKRIFKYHLLNWMSKIGMDVFAQKIFSKNVDEMQEWKENEYQLHGACLIFSKKYIDMFDGLYDKTFMYMEEGILKYIAKKKLLKMVYLPNLEVYHKEGSSTSKIYGKGKKQRQFFYYWSIDSCKILIELMQGKEKGKGNDI